MYEVSASATEPATTVATDLAAAVETTDTEIAAAPTLPANDNTVSINPESTSCSCNKSKCLKLYCECFSCGNKCGKRCDCNECCNDGLHDEELVKAMKAVLDRKPDAFSDEIKQTIGYFAEDQPVTKKRGRPKGSLNKNKSIILDPMFKRPRGRPRKDGNNPPIECLTPPPEAIEFNTEEYPQLSMNPTEDHSHLAASFTRPLFPPTDPATSKPLQIAYSHHAVARHARRVAQFKKKKVLDEYKRIREKYLEKKLELSLANDEVKKHNKEAGAWTKKVFDLELKEPCQWNEKLEKLRRYKEDNDKLPPKNIHRCKEGDEKELAKWLEQMRGNKIQESDTDNEGDDATSKKQTKIDLTDYPHRVEALKAFNIQFKQKSQNKFETMFQKLIDYKEEHGTLRFPSDEQCAASGDEDIIALQKWVKSQVLNFRYSKKKTDPSIVKRFVDIGFSFERWFAKPGKKKSDTKFDEIAKNAAEEAEGEVDEYGCDEDEKMATEDAEELQDAQEVEDGEEEEQLMENGGNRDSNLEFASIEMEQV